MADYNIYIHGDGNGNNDPLKPNQLKDEGVNGIDPTRAVSEAASFLQNPDSAIGKVMGAGIGAIAKSGVIGAIAVIIGKTVINVTDRCITLYNNYSASASGNYSRQINYNNFKQSLHNAFNPISTEIQRQQAQLEINKSNAVNEQEMLLLGGSILNSRNGRYL